MQEQNTHMDNFISGLIEGFRKKNGLTQIEFGKLAGVSQASISRIMDSKQSNAAVKIVSYILENCDGHLTIQQLIKLIL